MPVTPVTNRVRRLVVPPFAGDALAANLGDYVHAACSCALGSVLDANAGVIGYDGLSVCDASAMPDLPRANTHLTTVAMAELCAHRWTH